MAAGQWGIGVGVSVGQARRARGRSASSGPRAADLGRDPGAIRRMIAGENVTQESSGMSKGEWRELMSVLGKAV